MKRIAREGTLKPHDVRVPGVLVDYIVVDPDQKQTTQTLYDPAISGEIFRPLDTFRLPEFNIHKGDCAPCRAGIAGGQCGQSGFWHFRQCTAHSAGRGPAWCGDMGNRAGAVGGVPLLDFAFGCASNADAYMPSPYQFTYFQGAGFDASLLSALP